MTRWVLAAIFFLHGSCIKPVTVPLKVCQAGFLLQQLSSDGTLLASAQCCRAAKRLTRPPFVRRNTTEFGYHSNTNASPRPAQVWRRPKVLFGRHSRQCYHETIPGLIRRSSAT